MSPGCLQFGYAYPIRTQVCEPVALWGGGCATKLIRRPGFGALTRHGGSRTRPKRSYAAAIVELAIYHSRERLIIEASLTAS